MRVAIDLIPITGRNAGLQSYAKQLVEGLAKVDKENEYVLLINSRAWDLLAIDQPNFINLRVRTPKRFIGFWEEAYLPLVRALKGVDLLHSPVSAPPLWAPCKTVVTVHDLTFELYPQTMYWLHRYYWRFFLTRSIFRAERIIADSVSTKKGLVECFNVSEDLISAVPLCCASQFYELPRDGAVDALKRKLAICNRYILFVGTLEPRKNIPTLIKAFHLAKHEGGIEHLLVIAGSKGWLFESIFRMVKELGLEHDVIFTGFVVDEELPSLYQGADLFVYPSLYEGFGLPVLEAMACGTPVITSNSSSLPEAVGDAGILVDPQDVEGLARVMLKVLSNEALSDELAHKGKLQAQWFTAERMARETIRVYRSVLGGR